jgi:signal transduction histidine kinase/ActR/RegA family two-component response regulator
LLDKGDLVLMTTEQQAPLLSLHLDDVTGGSLRSPLDQNAVGYLVYKDAHGRKQMAGYSRLSAYGANQAGNWKLITLAPYQAILAPMTQSFNRMFGILLATLVGAAGLGLWLARRLANPILKLTESAKTIAAGRFDIRVAVTTRDEIGTLGDAFNLMAGTLQTEIAQRANAQEWLRVANNELEQRVEERTAQLMAEIDERKRAEVEMHYAKTAAESANRSKSEFLASMSHELRTPLNAILNISESLGEGVYGAVNDKQQRSLHTVSESGRHLLGLINDILDLSKIEAGKVELAMGEVTIRPLCEASLRLIREQALRKAQDVSLAIEDGVTVVQADERRLKQILVNLLSNAIKFTPDGGRVGLEVGAADGTIAFTVWDNGIGISPDNLKKLFKPFVQLDSKLSRQYAGTGLGLSLAQRMAALHKGRIEVESELETGSRFTVYLPGNRSNSDGRVARAKIQCVAAEAKKIKGEGPLVLLVEDTQANRECIGDYLLAKGFRLQFATNGLDAIAHASDLRPDIILMDIQMPGMDGFEAIRQLRENPELAKTPVIALTALAMEGDSERCLAAGATHYVSKPVALKELVATMRAIVNESAPNNGRSKAPLHEPGID